MRKLRLLLGLVLLAMAALASPARGYTLISVDAYNGRWADYRSYPVGNEDLTIEKAVGRGDGTDIYWFNFTDFQTQAIVPDPSGMAAVLVAGVMSLSGRRR